MKFSDYPSGYAPAKVFYDYLKSHNVEDIIKIDTTAFSTDSRGNSRISIRVKDASGEWKIPKVDTNTFIAPFAPKSDKYESKPKIIGNKFTADKYDTDADKNRFLKPDTTPDDASPIYLWAELFSDMVHQAVKKAIEDGKIGIANAKSKKTAAKIPLLPSKDDTFWSLVKKDGLYPSFHLTFNNKKWDNATKTPVKKSFTTPDGRTVESEVLGTKVYDETESDTVPVEISEANINSVITPYSEVLALVSIPRVTLHSKGISPTTEIDVLTVIRQPVNAKESYVPSIKGQRTEE